MNYSTKKALQQYIHH